MPSIQERVRDVVEQVNDHPLKRVACEAQADVDQFALRSNR